MEPAMVKLQEALNKRYWSRLPNSKSLSSDVKLKPFNDVVSYVLKAWKARLDRRQECALAGSKLLDSVVKTTDRRFADNAEEANELFLAGMDVANYLWDELIKLKGNTSALQAKVVEINNQLLREVGNAG